jgi:hypothetical protein
MSHMLAHDIIGGIPKFHLAGHKQSCYDRFSLNYIQYVGRIEGEGCERAWAYLNETAGSTSEMSPGFRRDSICYIIADWNFNKMIGMGEFPFIAPAMCLNPLFPAVFLSRKYQIATKQYAKQLEDFQNLDACVPDSLKAVWQTLPLKAKEGPKGVWTSVFSTPSSKGGGVPFFKEPSVY